MSYLAEIEHGWAKPTTGSHTMPMLHEVHDNASGQCEQKNPQLLQTVRLRKGPRNTGMALGKL